jgi:nickel-dependent lactate racemase
LSLAGDALKTRAGISLPYGRSEQKTFLPNGWALDLVASMDANDVPSPRQALHQALNAPLVLPSLTRCLPSTGRILLMISPHQHDGLKCVLSLLLEYLNGNGISNDRIHLMFSQRNPGSNPKEIVGEELLNHHTHFSHANDDCFRHIGTTLKGSKISVLERLWDYQLLIPVSPVRPDVLLGFHGGCKVLIPETASRQTMESLYRLALKKQQNAHIKPATLNKNPIHESIIEALGMMQRPVFLLTYITGQDPETFAAFFAGDMFQANLAACRAYLRQRIFTARRKFDLVLSSSGGVPHDSCLLNITCDLHNAHRLIRPGGTIIHLAECKSGLGQEDLVDWIQNDYPLPENGDPKSLPATLELSTLWELTQQAHFILVSSLPKDVVTAMGMHPAVSLSEALHQVLPHLPFDHSTALFPEAGSLLPVQAIPARDAPIMAHEVSQDFV